MELVTGPRIVAVGEGMVELSADGDRWRMAYGGDVLNTAVHLARLGRNVAFATGLGADPFSQRLRRAWAAEGLDLSLVATHPRRMPGLYAISLDDRRERSFHYWRETSAARRLLARDQDGRIREGIATANLVYLSLITLAVLADELDALLDACAAARRAGGQVAFDPNYRPALWPDPEAARAACRRIAALTDIALPGADDHEQLFAHAEPADAIAFWRDHGVPEVVLKRGRDPALVVDGTGTRAVAAEARGVVVDTSGAGDAFNAGYLHARLSGVDAGRAAADGHALAAWTIGRNGAIPDRDGEAPYAAAAGGRPGNAGD